MINLDMMIDTPTMTHEGGAAAWDRNITRRKRSEKVDNVTSNDE